MQQQQTKQGAYYYHIPLSQQEAFLFSKTTDKTPQEFYIRFFKDLLTSGRPEQIYDAAYITMSRSSMTPNKIHWKRFDDGDKPSLQTYSMVSKEVADELERYRKKHPRFARFDRNIMRPKIPASSVRSQHPPAHLLQDMILGHLQGLQDRSSNKSVPHRVSAAPDPYSIIVLFLMVILGLAFLYRRRQVAPLLEDVSFTDNIKSFIKKIKDPEEKKQFQELLQELQQKKTRKILKDLQVSLGNEVYSRALVRYINKAEEEDIILQGTAMFLTTLPDATKNRFMRILKEATGKNMDPKIQAYYKEFRNRKKELVMKSSMFPSVPPQRKSRVVQKEQQVVSIQKETQKQKPSAQSILRHLSSQFFTHNQQLAVSPMGTMSPHFARSLMGFLKQHGAIDPEEFKGFIHHHARQLIKTNPAIRLPNMNSKLSDLMTTQQWDAYKGLKKKKQQQQKISKTESLKSIRQAPKEQQVQQQKQQQESGKEQQTPGQHLMPVVQRIKKPYQTRQMADIMNTNMENILGSKKYQKAISTLSQVLESHPGIRHIFIVDAPNLLFTGSGTFRERQQTATSPQFIQFLRQVKGMDKTDMIVIVSQMNLRKWLPENDPVRFHHILDDRENIFHLQVGCADPTKQKMRDCFETTGSNEMDDFVRLDLMARLAHRFKQRKFELLSNDKGKNWQLVETYLKK